MRVVIGRSLGASVVALGCDTLVENLGYRQLLAFWRFRAFWDLLRGHSDWGDMRRKGFTTTVEAPLPPS